MNLDEEEFEYTFKIVLIGNSGVGKSCLLQTFLQSNTDQTSQATLGVDFKICSINIDDQIIKLQLWDTAGQERFRSMVNSYYKGAHAVLLVYDITNKQSFIDIDHWLFDIERHSDKNVTKVLIGNKKDLEDERQVSIEEGQDYARQLKVSFFETSIKESEDVTRIFTTAAHQVKARFHTQTQSMRKNNMRIARLSTAKSIHANDEASMSTYRCC